PGVMILLTTLSLNVLSEGMTDALATPKAKADVDVHADELRMAESQDGAEARILEVDPAVTRAELDARLATLRASELSRDDRLVLDGAPAPLLEVKNLSIAFPGAHGEVNIVDDVSFSVRPGETM